MQAVCECSLRQVLARSVPPVHPGLGQSTSQLSAGRAVACLNGETVAGQQLRVVVSGPQHIVAKVSFPIPPLFFCLHSMGVCVPCNPFFVCVHKYAPP